MTIEQLIVELNMLADEHGDDVEVRIAYQPSYPLAAEVAAVTVDEDRPVVWLAASDTVPTNENPYAPATAWG